MPDIVEAIAYSIYAQMPCSHLDIFVTHILKDEDGNFTTEVELPPICWHCQRPVQGVQPVRGEPQTLMDAIKGCYLQKGDKEKFQTRIGEFIIEHPDLYQE